ncbi:Inter-alpha-trypsin inhibitor heavy chain H3 [Holothuria leucospilota]|uniref:Inter-alpha-trypsin inhibitor heavy chain H3 n=1 Tax=Holothuria leucospilota TaxID=206669 RepID=A0A9Q1CIT5_HOLLE|nr:Inter-alpha-trypsin inhibitor heavy chain H3 [Holothuria leucospilota]
MKVFILQSLLLLLSRTPTSFTSPVFSVDDQLNLHRVVERNVFDVACQTGTSGDGDGSGGSGEYSDCEREQETILKPTKPYPKPHILSLKVDTTITARYVSTTVVTTMINEAPVSQDSNFRFRLSDESFISDFFMVVNDQVYQSEVKEKEAAQKAYNEAKSRGQTASQVKQSDTDFTKFETNVNLSPNTTASFHLTFQEHLRRKNGVFRYKINLFPNEIVQELMADVYITEPQGISFANITWEQDYLLNNYTLYNALSVDNKSDTEVHAHFNPSAVDQEGVSTSGLEGDLVITYDVVHGNSAGQIEIVNGYFVHHISPVNLNVTRKNVVFVIDTSGSMYGTKIAQTKDAMETIIDDVREFDRFNIITFASSADQWKSNLVNATKENKEEAKVFVNGFVASGGTNLHYGLMLAVRVLKDMEEGSDDSLLEASDSNDALPMIILLTDGQPTSGHTDSTYIVNSITKEIQGDIALFSLAFGTGADYKLLEKLSGHNQGLARQIYEDSSANLQLEGFYDEVATPLLHHVSVQYPEDKVEVDSLTQTNFISYFEGTELVIAGKLKENFTGNELSAVVSANSFDINYEWGLTKEIARPEEEIDQNDPVLKPRVVDDFARRLWAYATIKSLLEKQNIAMTSAEKLSLRERALLLALNYTFVTPLTSLIIIKPDEEMGFGNSIGEDVSNTAPRGGGRPSRRGYLHSGSGGKDNSRGGDPHIVVEDPDSEVRLCFDIHGQEGTVVSLVEDPILGVTVNGEMVEKDTFTSVKLNTSSPSYFGRIAIQLGQDWITISPDSILINVDRHLKWVLYSEANISSCRLEISKEELVKLSCENGVVMNVLRHEIPGDSNYHFDFFLGEGRMFSDSANGIIGQFQRRSLTVLESSVRHLVRYGGRKAQLSLDGKNLKVYEIYRPRTGTCWATYAKKGLPMLETKYEDYKLPNLFSKLSPN